MFQNPEMGEIMHYFPAFALSWSLNWGRITNGERVIEDIPIIPQVDLLPVEPDRTSPLYISPIVHARWEQISKADADGAPRNAC